MFLVAEIRFCADIAEFLQTVKGINGRGSGKFAKYASAKQRLPKALWVLGKHPMGYFCPSLELLAASGTPCSRWVLRVTEV